MVYLISLAIIGIAIGLFSTQNTTPVSLYWAGYSLPNIPVYLVMLGSMLIGFLVAGLVGALNSLSSFFTLRRKESLITERGRHVEQLQEKVHSLEIENERLKNKEDHHVTPVETDQETFSEKLRHRFSFR